MGKKNARDLVKELRRRLKKCEKEGGMRLDLNKEGGWDGEWIVQVRLGFFLREQSAAPCAR